MAANPSEATSPPLPDDNLSSPTIVAGYGNGVSAHIHNGMPVWLQAGQIEDWKAVNADDAMAILLVSQLPNRPDHTSVVGVLFPISLLASRKEDSAIGLPPNSRFMDEA